MICITDFSKLLILPHMPLHTGGQFPPPPRQLEPHRTSALTTSTVTPHLSKLISPHPSPHSRAAATLVSCSVLNLIYLTGPASGCLDLLTLCLECSFLIHQPVGSLPLFRALLKCHFFTREDFLSSLSPVCPPNTHHYLTCDAICLLVCLLSDSLP